MLVITKSASARAARDYFDKSLRIGDYYREGERVAGVWHGAAAARLGLAGEVRRGQFCALVENRHPQTREQLTPRQKADRVPGFDFTFTAPKSVSVLYALTGDDRITEALRHAVRDAMAEVEREMKTRVRAKGRNEDRVTGNMAWVEFLHHTARPIGGIPDPHLHIHAYAMNLTFDQVERRWKAAQIGDIKGEAIYYEATFHAAQLQEDAAEDNDTVEKFIAGHKGGLIGYLGELMLWCREQLRAAESRPTVLALAAEVRTKRLIMSGDDLDLLGRYQTTLDNQLYKALRAFREAQEWRLKAIEASPALPEAELVEPARAA